MNLSHVESQGLIISKFSEQWQSSSVKLYLLMLKSRLKQEIL